MAILEQAETRPINDWSFARIGYRTVLSAANSTSAALALIPNTWERWTSASGTMTATFQSAASKVNYIAIGAHNLFSAGVTNVLVSVSTTVGSGYVVVGSIRPISNTPLYFNFDDRLNIRDIQITITGGTNREVGVVYAGESLVMIRGIFGGHSPITLSSVTEYRNSTSDSGQFLGRNIRRKGLASQFSWQNIPDDWYRQYFQPFVVVAKTRPFFIQWRPDYHSNEVAFGYTTGDISPSNQSGIKRMMSVNFSMRAHDE